MPLAVYVVYNYLTSAYRIYFKSGPWLSVSEKSVVTGLFQQMCPLCWNMEKNIATVYSVLCYRLKRIFFLVSDWMSSSTLVWNFTIASHSQGFSSAHRIEKSNYLLKSMPFTSTGYIKISHICCQQRSISYFIDTYQHKSSSEVSCQSPSWPWNQLCRNNVLPQVLRQSSSAHPPQHCLHRRHTSCSLWNIKKSCLVINCVQKLRHCGFIGLWATQRVGCKELLRMLSCW